MSKRLEKGFGESLAKKISIPIRKKKDIVIILLETMKIFQLDNIIEEQNISGVVFINIDKMSRIFYQLEDKYFSFNFPFRIEMCDQDSCKIKFYDYNTGIILDSRMISILIRIFKDKKDSLEDFYYELSYVEQINNVEDIWRIVKSLMIFESGYLRYDYDSEHENGKLHPLNHFDIYYSSGNSFKIGLNTRITVKEFMDILDIQTECYYLGKI